MNSPVPTDAILAFYQRSLSIRPRAGNPNPTGISRFPNRQTLSYDRIQTAADSRTIKAAYEPSADNIPPKIIDRTDPRKAAKASGLTMLRIGFRTSKGAPNVDQTSPVAAPPAITDGNPARSAAAQSFSPNHGDAISSIERPITHMMRRETTARTTNSKQRSAILNRLIRRLEAPSTWTGSEHSGQRASGKPVRS